MESPTKHPQKKIQKASHQVHSDVQGLESPPNHALKGLLVLEALALSDAQCPWFEHVKDILEKEKLQRAPAVALF